MLCGGERPPHCALHKHKAHDVFVVLTFHATTDLAKLEAFLKVSCQLLVKMLCRHTKNHNPCRVRCQSPTLCGCRSPAAHV